MGPGVRLAETVDAVVRVDLRRLQRGVSQQLLYLAYVGSVVEQMGGIGVPQYVGTFLPLHSGIRQPPLHRTVDGAPRNAFRAFSAQLQIFCRSICVR